MFDRDNFSADDFMGETVLFSGDFIDLPVGRPDQDWYQVHSLNARAGMTLQPQLPSVKLDS